MAHKACKPLFWVHFKYTAKFQKSYKMEPRCIPWKFLWKFLWKFRKYTRDRSNDSFSGIFSRTLFLNSFGVYSDVLKIIRNGSSLYCIQYFMKIVKTLGTLSRVPLLPIPCRWGKTRFSLFFTPWVKFTIFPMENPPKTKYPIHFEK